MLAISAAVVFINTPMRSTSRCNRLMIVCACPGVILRLLGAKIKPSASAPASMELSASSREVVPQILIQVRMQFIFRESCFGFLLDCATPMRRSRGGWRIPSRILQELLQFLPGVLSAHQRFANQEGLIAGGMKLTNLRAAIDSALRHAQHVVGNAAGQIDYGIQADLKCLEISAVHPDDVRSTFNRPLQLFFVMNFTKRIKVQSAGVIQQSAEGGVAKGPHNNNNSVGMVSAGLSNLEFIHNKIFA